MVWFEGDYMGHMSTAVWKEETRGEEENLQMEEEFANRGSLFKWSDFFYTVHNRLWSATVKISKYE